MGFSALRGVGGAARARAARAFPLLRWVLVKELRQFSFSLGIFHIPLWPFGQASVTPRMVLKHHIERTLLL
ncbi:hypothetical protein WSI_05015 [Candidatus Liberibacter asiaticus str. gxpsy]|uniref:Uncharacterized protein n=1 Tax=Candidatus Liberibacter asiaticus str. gxpsy TaxID=1174529 RepID=A0ABM5NHD5_LIBAS|nr:hypothetical protein WSI_05015 [Candidatus Liberibacter asiaticus str. gxpsy]